MPGINKISTERVTIDEMITEISLSEIHSFKNHPFKVVDDERMMDTAESIRAYIAVKMPDRKAATMAKTIIQTLGAFPSALVKTITCDRGTEFATGQR